MEILDRSYYEDIISKIPYKYGPCTPMRTDEVLSAKRELDAHISDFLLGPLHLGNEDLLFSKIEAVVTRRNPFIPFPEAPLNSSDPFPDLTLENFRQYYINCLRVNESLCWPIHIHTVDFNPVVKGFRMPTKAKCSNYQEVVFMVPVSEMERIAKLVFQDQETITYKQVIN